MINDYIVQIASTIILLLLLPIMRFLIRKITRKYASLSSFLESRTKMMLKYLYILINMSAIIMLVVIWGVNPQNIFMTLSSVFAVIGVALFAQWSLLSNITSGVIIFFTMHMRIGDKIIIHDKDFPIEAEIEDIKAFHTYLRSSDGEQIVYPNNLILQKGITICQRPTQE